MEESKYYTPSIEEFHIGFEFECQDLSTALWMDCVYRLNWMLEDMDISEWLDDQYSFGIRVKYLDREDIESLGFNNSNHQDSIFLKPIKHFMGRPAEAIGINFNDRSDHVLVFYVPDGSKIPAGVNLFVGTIKNKSELKKVLKMIGV